MKYYVYERLYDLTEYPQEILKKYGLEQGYYFYVGCSNQKNLRKRCTRWKSHIVAEYHISNKIVSFIKKYKKFLENETDLTKKEINEALFYNADKKYKNIDDKKSAKLLESCVIGLYRLFEETNQYETFRPKYFVLNQLGSVYKIKDNKVSLNTSLEGVTKSAFIKTRNLEDYIIKDSRINDLC